MNNGRERRSYREVVSHSVVPEVIKKHVLGECNSCGRESLLHEHSSRIHAHRPRHPINIIFNGCKYDDNYQSPQVFSLELCVDKKKTEGREKRNGLHQINIFSLVFSFLQPSPDMCLVEPGLKQRGRVFFVRHPISISPPRSTASFYQRGVE